MSAFIERLRQIQKGRESEGRQWVFVAYDQLTDQLEPLSSIPVKELGIILVETTWKPAQRPYHKQKLGWILANQRHFALEQAKRGALVRYVFGDRDYGEIIREQAQDVGRLKVMRPAEWELRRLLKPLVDEGLLEMVPHGGWLTTSAQFQESQSGDPPWRMDSFYRLIRRQNGILMEDGKPLGGQFSLDEENREFWPGSPKAPELPIFEPDSITKEVGELIEAQFGDHPGVLDLEQIAATREDAREQWQWALDECMEHFGPFEDAMSQNSRTLFHTRISPLLNLHRILPTEVIEDVLELEIPLNSKEGFIRQVLGWREFMRHVHEQTEGFRALPGDFAELSSGDSSRGATPNFLEADRGLPPAYWGAKSGLLCLDDTVQAVVEEGYSHHISRLMVLSNLATLLAIDPREVTDWFWEMYIDAFDWVVEPNVLGMGTFAMSNLFTTKPYVSGSNYIHKMSDYCGDCAFHPKKNCPIGSLYWAFLDRQQDRLAEQGRMNLMLSMVRRRSEEKRAWDGRVFELVSEWLEAGEVITPERLDEAKGQVDD